MPGVAPNGAGRLFCPANPDLADILGDMDFEYEIFFFVFYFLFFGVPNSQDFQNSRNLAWARLGPGLGPAWARAWAQAWAWAWAWVRAWAQTPLAPPDEFSDPNLTPLPTHPGIKYVARSPCCDQELISFVCFPVRI